MSKFGTKLQLIGPGILVAATGVGAGDLATASLTGANLGLTVLWAVVVGAFLKFVLNEGLTRWQLATGSTLVEGCVERLGRSVQWLFLAYLVVWSFLVGAALSSAIGVTSHAILPLAGTGSEAARIDKIVYGIVHSALAVMLVRLGGYRLFEKVMSACIGMMFVVVVLTAAALRPPIGEFLRGLLIPTIPSGGVLWTVALLGGVGGTVTVLCYGYWIREEGRQGIDELATCRVDLAVGYVMTAIFGLAMVAIGNSLGAIEGGGATLVVQIAERLETAFGRAGPLVKWAFLAGAWGAVFSSLLGVWQSVPYLFADLWQLIRANRGHGNRQRSPVDTNSLAYRGYLYGIAVLPILGLVAVNFQLIQKAYAVVGALFIPMLAGVLLYLNGRSRWVGEKHKNSPAASAVLIGALLLFLLIGASEVYDSFWGASP
jgi:Mn2+/Fe2+ NRAMP family transporter